MAPGDQEADFLIFGRALSEQAALLRQRLDRHDGLLVACEPARYARRSLDILLDAICMAVMQHPRPAVASCYIERAVLALYHACRPSATDAEAKPLSNSSTRALQRCLADLERNEAKNLRVIDQATKARLGGAVPGYFTRLMRRGCVRHAGPRSRIAVALDPRDTAAAAAVAGRIVLNRSTDGSDVDYGAGQAKLLRPDQPHRAENAVIYFDHIDMDRAGAAAERFARFADRRGLLARANAPCTQPLNRTVAYCQYTGDMTGSHGDFLRRFVARILDGVHGENYDREASYRRACTEFRRDPGNPALLAAA
ncbi:hypothetical protein GN316_17160 [Xylophilus sp. Kf1]|nr:hypothetical protein [Xylophilus sp. Kf1]